MHKAAWKYLHNTSRHCCRKKAILHPLLLSAHVQPFPSPKTNFNRAVQLAGSINKCKLVVKNNLLILIFRQDQLVPQVTLQNSHMTLANRRKHCRKENTGRNTAGARKKNRGVSYASIAGFYCKVI